METQPTQAGFSSGGTYYSLFGSTNNVIVLIHGLGLNQEMWEWQIDALCKDYSVLTYDLTGSGQSAAPEGTPSLSMFSVQLADLLEELGIERAIVAGFSLGGMIARRFAMDFPDRVKALAILNSAHKRDAAAHDAIQARVYQAEKEGPAATVDAALGRWFTSDYRDAHPEVMDFIKDTILANDKAIYPKNYQVLVDGVEELIAPNPPISCPALVMTAEEDYGNSPEMSAAISSEISGSELVILPGLRHMAMVEAPEMFNMQLLNFLNRVN